MGKKLSKGRQDSLVAEENVEDFEAILDHALYINIHEANNANIVFNLSVKKKKKALKLLKTMKTTFKRKDKPCQCSENTEDGIEENIRRNENDTIQTSFESVLPCSKSLMLAISSSSKDSPFEFRKEHNDSITLKNKQFQGLHAPEINSGQFENTTLMHNLKDSGEEPDYDRVSELDAEFRSQNMQRANYTVIRPSTEDDWKKTQTVEKGLTLSFLTSASDNNCYSCSICERKELRTDLEKNRMSIENKSVNNTEEKKMNNLYTCSFCETKEMRTDLEKSKLLIKDKIKFVESVHVEEMKLNTSHCSTLGSEYPMSTSYERNSCSDESLDVSDKLGSIEENDINYQDKQNYKDSNLCDTVLKKENILEEVLKKENVMEKAQNSVESFEDKKKEIGFVPKTNHNLKEESPQQNGTSYMITKDYSTVNLNEANGSESESDKFNISDVAGLMKREPESLYVDENIEIEHRKDHYLSEYQKMWYLIVCDRNVTTVVMIKDILKTVEKKLDLHRKICLADLTEYNALHGVSFISDLIIVQHLSQVIFPVCEEGLFLFTSNHVKRSAAAVYLIPLHDVHISQGNILDLCVGKLCGDYIYNLSCLDLEVHLDSQSNGLTRCILYNVNKEDFQERGIVFNCYKEIYVLCHLQSSHTQLAIEEGNHCDCGTEIPLASKFIRPGTLRLNSLILPVCALCCIPQILIHEEMLKKADELSNSVDKLFLQIFNSKKLNENIQPYSATIEDTVLKRKVGLFEIEEKRTEFQITEEEKVELNITEKERAEFHITEEKRDELHVTEEERAEFHPTEDQRNELNITEEKSIEIQETREERAEFQDKKEISDNGNDSGYLTRHSVSEADSDSVSVLNDISYSRKDNSNDGNGHHNLEPIMNETDCSFSSSICLASTVDSLTVQRGKEVKANESVTTADTELTKDFQKQKKKCLTKARSKLHRKEKQPISCSTSTLSQNYNISDSDSSIDQESVFGNNLCQYCKQSLDMKNKKCKHHKPIQLPKAEQNSDDDSEHEGIKNRAIITQAQKDSGLGSSLHNSCFSKQQLNEFRNQVETVARRELERLTAKEVAREIHYNTETTSIIYGLSSYFDRLNSGEPISEEERLHYEWLRLATFQHYTGEGNSITLARHGFYHDPSAGPTSTRCYLCEARHSNWTYFDNVEAEHRRQSPNCPFHENRNQESTNIPITYDNTSQSAARGPPAINTTNPNQPSTVASNVTDDRGSITSSIREVTGSLTQAQISSTRNASVQQPQDNDESRQHSLLALPNSRPYRVLGRSGETAYSHLTTPPRRNNIATGAESNAGLDAIANSTATSTATSTTTSTFRPSSILGGPIGAGAFGGNASNPPASSTAPTSSSVTSTSALPRGISSAKASLLTPSQPPIGGGGRTDPTITVVVNNPKHPDYRDLDARINSFQGWPDYLDQTARQMSEAGFFFVGVADFTRCFCCGGGLRNWEPGDDPMLEHTRWFPRCEYVNKLKGERYVAAVQRRHQEHMAEQQRQQQELAQRRDANRNPPDPMNTEAAAVLREMGYQQERIRDAILAVRQQIGVPDVTTQQVLAWLLDQHEGRSPPTSNRTSPTRDLGVKVNMVVTPSTTQTSTPSTVINTTASVSTATSTVLAGSTSTSTVSSTSTATGAGNQQSGSSTSSTGSTGAGSKPASQSGSEAREGSNVDKQSAATRGESDEEEFKSAEETPSPDVKSTGKKKSKKKTKTKGGSKSTGASGGPVDAKSLKEENEKLREMQTCKICMERPVNTTLLPCGHLVCCDICAGRLNRCPICRKRIQGTVKTFMS